MDSISVGPTNSLEKASKAPEQSADDPFAALLAQVPSLTADTSSLQSTSSVQSDPFADLMSSIPDFGGGTSASTTSDALGNASDKLQKLIADGAAYGIHFIVCSSDYQTVKAIRKAIGAPSYKKVAGKENLYRNEVITDYQMYLDFICDVLQEQTPELADGSTTT